MGQAIVDLAHVRCQCCILLQCYQVFIAMLSSLEEKIELQDAYFAQEIFSIRGMRLKIVMMIVCDD